MDFSIKDRSHMLLDHEAERELLMQYILSHPDCPFSIVHLHQSKDRHGCLASSRQRCAA